MPKLCIVPEAGAVRLMAGALFCGGSRVTALLVFLAITSQKRPGLVPLSLQKRVRVLVGVATFLS